MHGGPCEACDDCRQLRQALDPGHSEEDWLTALKNWHKHLAIDTGGHFQRTSQPATFPHHPGANPDMSGFTEAAARETLQRQYREAAARSAQIFLADALPCKGRSGTQCKKD